MRKIVFLALGLLLALSVGLPTGCGTGLSGGSGPLAITTSTLPSGTVGIAYGAALQASGGVAPYSFSVNGGSMPTGLALSTAGVLAGMPTGAGTASLTVLVTDSIGEKTTRTFGLTIAGTGSAASTLAISTAGLPGGTVATAYSASVTATGGTTPYIFAIESGSVPAGLSFTAAGVLAGTPTTPGTATFTVEVADAKGATASQGYSLTIGAAAAAANPLTITTTTLPAGVIGTNYNQTVVATGGTAPYVFTRTGGSLPPGMNLTGAGVISGIPVQVGTYSFTLTVADAKGLTASQTYSVAVSMFLEIGTLSLDDGFVGTAYSQQVSALGGTAPYTYAVTSGTLPAGLTFTPAGVLAGTPTKATGFTFTVTVTDATGATAYQGYSVLIHAAPAALFINTLTLQNGTAGTAYSGTVLALGGTSPYTYAVTSGNVPLGLTFTGGVLSGTPTTAGTYAFTVTATDAKSATASQAYSVTIVAGGASLSITTSTLAAGTVNSAYSAMLAANGGTSPYSFQVTSGSVPAGLTLSSAGLLSGTPSTTNTYSFTVTVTDANNLTSSRILSLEIDPSASATLLLTTTTPPNAVINTPYSYTLNVSNGTGTITFTVQSGSLPTGVTVSSAGLLAGTPTVTGSFPVTLSFTDGSSPKNSGTGTFTLVVVTASATVLVDTTTKLATVPANFFGLHTSVYDTNLDDASALPALLANTGITTLRYPGGGYSDSYHWAQYAITPYYATSSPACGTVSNGYLATGADFGHFAQLLLASSTSGLITINYGNSVADSAGAVTYGTDGKHTCSQPNTAGQPQEAAAWVAYANGDPSNTQSIGKDAVGFDWKTVGFWASLRAASPLSVDDGYNFLRIAHTAALGVKFWEIGNELYYDGWATNHNAESDNHAPYIYPNGYTGGTFDSRASLAALSPTAYGTNAIQFIQAMKAVDSTIKIGVDFSSPISTDPIPTTWNPDLAQAVCAGANIDFAIMHYYPGTWKAVQPGELLSLPQADIPNVAAGIRANLAQYCPANASNIGIWLTETAPNNGLAPNFPQPVIGLFTLNEFMTSLTTGIQNIDWLEMHDGSFLTESEVPGPSYYGLLLAHQLADVGDAAVKATSSTSAIVSYATVKANGQKGVVLINANSSSAITVQVSVSGSTLGATATEYSYGVNTTQSGTALTGTSFAVPGQTFSVSVPAYTAVELLIP